MPLARRFPFPSTTARLCTWYPAPTPSPSAPHHVMFLHSSVETQHPASHSLPRFKGSRLPCPSISFREVATSFLTQDQPLPVCYLNQSSFWFLLSLIQQIPLEPLFWARCWATHGTQGDTHSCSVLQEPTGQSTHGSTCLLRLLPASHGPGLSHGPTSSSSCCPRLSSLSCRSSGSP